ncbi:MAG TPA: glutathione S-transferase family protein [Rhodanobacteraceae bacterium]|jgi:glutathione S-transferase|nr:glutathione S-transferase family protein [Rhodanobacteraceae bacterium]
MTPILYCHRESGHSYKVALALTLMDVPFEQRAVDLNLPRDERPADFRQASLFGEVPAFVDEDGLAVTQSNAILDHVARRYGKLDGTTPATRTRVREWLAWEANRIAMSLPHLRFSRRFTPAGETLETYWTGRMRADLDRLDRALGKNTFLAGDAPTIADMSCCGYLFWADQAEVDLTRWPAVVAWLERIRSLPRFKAPYDLLDDRFPIRPGTRT